MSQKNRFMGKGRTRVAAAGVLAVLALWAGAAMLLPRGFTTPPGQQLSFSAAPWLRAGAGAGRQAAAGTVGGAGPEKTVAVRLFGVLPLGNVTVRSAPRATVLLGGQVFGIKMFQDGAMVVGFSTIEHAGGKACPARDAGLAAGDIVTGMNGNRVTTNDQVAAILEKAAGAPVEVAYTRGSEARRCMLTAVRDAVSGKWRCGMWVRDSTAGIGTMSFVMPETGVFAGLGHSINDGDTGVAVPLLAGEIAPVRVTGVTRGRGGAPGQLLGSFTPGPAAGLIRENHPRGVYGILYETAAGQAVETAYRQETETGPAVILSDVDGAGPRWYTVEIERVSMAGAAGKDMLLRVTDKRLLEATGGIVQGMSGSPVVQNGRLVGRHPCAGERPHPWLRHFCRGYGGTGTAGGKCPCPVGVGPGGRKPGAGHDKLHLTKQGQIW